MNIRAQCLLFLMKLAKNHSFAELSTLFTLGSHVSAQRIFVRILLNHFKHNTTIRPVVDLNGNANDAEIDSMLIQAYDNMSVKFRELTKNLKDPFADRYPHERIGVLVGFDGTYAGFKRPQDIQVQKSLYYDPRGGHIVKILTFTDASGKCLAVLPLSASSSPSNGEHYQIQTLIRLDSRYIRSIIRGNDRFFVILVVDSGLTIQAQNRPNEVRGLPTLSQTCDEEGCFLIHTSNKWDTYHFQKQTDGKIMKVPRNPAHPTMDENCVKYTRLFRMPQEQMHAPLHFTYQINNERKLDTYYLDPLPLSILTRYGLEEFEDVPLYSFIITCCLSLFNQFHPGFKPAMSEQDQRDLAESLMTRLFLENPLLHPVWNIDFDRGRLGRGNWMTTTLAALAENDILNFPKITEIEQLKAAILLCSGKHAIIKADQIITYMIQLNLADRNLTRAETIEALATLPEDEFEIEYLRVVRPDDDPNWTPPGWDVDLFGEWMDVTFVRCFMPSSNRSMSSRANGHYCVIGFGEEGSDRMGLPEPYNRIYYFRCFNCPSLNGSMALDRHLAGMLKLLSFKQWYKSTQRTFALLNTQAPDNRYIYPLFGHF